MAKPKLVCVGETFLTKPTDHHSDFFSKYFDISDYDDRCEYDSDHNFVYRFKEDQEKVSKYRSKGCRFIADGLWEKRFFCDVPNDADTLGLVNNGFYENDRVIQVPRFFWFEEHVAQGQRKKLVQSWPHEHTKQKDFLMLIGKHKPQRAKILDELEKRKLLDNGLYSVLYEGKALEGKIDSYVPGNRDFSQRNYDPVWYQSTNYTVVVESDWEEDVFITEKTLKPIMYGHPFIVFGNTGTLAQLEAWGFKTYSEVFDQSYDSETNTGRRLLMVVDQVEKVKDIPAVANEKAKYNFDRFWDTQLVEKFMYEDMVVPLMNFVNR